MQPGELRAVYDACDWMFVFYHERRPDDEDETDTTWRLHPADTFILIGRGLLSPVMWKVLTPRGVGFSITQDIERKTKLLMEFP